MTLREIVNKTAPGISYPRLIEDVRVETDFTKHELKNYLKSTTFTTDADLLAEMISEAKDDFEVADFMLSLNKRESGKRFIIVELP